MSKRIDDLLREAASKGRAEERLLTLRRLLRFHSPKALLDDPKFQPFAYAQEEIQSALALNQKADAKKSRKRTVVSAANREIIENFRMLDDLYMREILKDNIPGVQDIVRIVLQRPDLKVVSLETEADYPNLRGHGIRFDVLAQDEQGNLYDIEIQRDSRGVSPKRARFCLSALDWNKSQSGDDYDKLVETWVIFITEGDVYTNGAPFVDVERYFVGTDVKFEDGQHIRFVSAAYNGDDPIGRLMADIRETDPDKMTTPTLAEPARIIKRTKKGMEEMSATIERLLEIRGNKEREEGRKEGKEEGRKEGKEEGRESERVRTISVLLNYNSPESLLNDPQFTPLGYTQAEIDAAMAFSR